MKTARIQVGNSPDVMLEIRSLAFANEPHLAKIISAWDDDDYTPSTLRDICIIMWHMVGQGVGWQLAEEISNKFNLDPYKVHKFLHNLFKEYSKLSEDDAIKREEASWSRNLRKEKPL